MSSFHVDVVRVDRVEPHPNADRLEICRIGGFPVVSGKGNFGEGDLAVYVPVDSCVPTDRPEFAFLAEPGKTVVRVKAKRLRGIASQGLLVPARPGWVPGQDVAGELGVTKWDPPEHPSIASGEDEHGPTWFGTYTDLEPLQRHPDVLRPGEPVRLTEKIHGCSGRFAHDGDRLWCGSMTRVKAPNPNSPWWRVAAEYELERVLSARPGVVLFGEVHGWITDLRYGAVKGEVRFRAFDAFDARHGHYLGCGDFDALCRELGIPSVPVLFEGPWGGIDDMLALAEGRSVAGGDHVREGFVVRPLNERHDDAIGRVVLKAVGHGYHMRRGG